MFHVMYHAIDVIPHGPFFEHKNNALFTSCFYFEGGGIKSIVFYTCE